MDLYPPCVPETKRLASVGDGLEPSPFFCRLAPPGGLSGRLVDFDQQVHRALKRPKPALALAVRPALGLWQARKNPGDRGITRQVCRRVRHVWGR